MNNSWESLSRVLNLGSLTGAFKNNIPTKFVGELRNPKARGPNMAINDRPILEMGLWPHTLIQFMNICNAGEKTIYVLPGRHVCWKENL